MRISENWTLISDPQPNMQFKNLKSNDQKVAKQAEAKWDGVQQKPTKLQFQSILNTENFDALQTLRINRSRP